jgi:adenine-specific DNA-methyltransferase
MEDWIAEGRIIFPDNPRVRVYASMHDLLEAMKVGDVPSSGRSPLLRPDLPDLEFWVGKPVAFGTPAFKRLKSELKNATQPLSSWVAPRSEKAEVESLRLISTGFNDEGAKAIKTIFGEKAFNYAKPPSLIRGLIEQATSPGDIVLDFFAGSATTAQAVMELNAADGGDRRFIMASSTEATADAPEVNICRDVTAQRIRRLNASDDPAFAELAAEFAYLRCRGVPFEELQALTSAEVWAAVEALHGLPLTTYEDGAAFQAHEGEAVTVVLMDRYAPELVAYLQRVATPHAPLVVYAWAPGQLRAAFPDPPFELHHVREALVRRFQQ